ncbi:DUF4232 domain-containing protein [Actinomycetota bacterium Odt1-20B]
MKFTRTSTRTVLAGISLVAALTLTACNGDDGTGVDTSGDSSSSASSGSSGGNGSSGGSNGSSGGGSSDNGSSSGGSSGSGKGNSGGQGTSGGNGSDANGKVEKCRTDDLDITAQDNTITGDPEGVVTVQMQNGSGQDCAISGYAGADLKTNSGTLSAKRSGEQIHPDILKDGESAAFNITFPLNDSGGSGVRITGLVVTPPDETKSFSMEWPAADSLPVTEGGGSSVKVGPVGKASGNHN